MTKVAILGGGPAGLGAAYRLRQDQKAEVVLLERGAGWGGNAGSFQWNGHHLDFGSHRLHPSCDPTVLADIQRLLGEDLLDRPRHGRIRLLGRWVHFPLKPADLLLHLKPSFALGAGLDAMRKVLPRKAVPEEDQTFASVLETSLGPSICRHFYFPYARKIWGHPPEALSAIQARKRVSASSFGKLLGKVLGQVPGLKKKGAGRFFYPRRGFGQISDAYAAAAAESGADLRTGTTVKALHIPDGDAPWRIELDGGGGSDVLEVDHVWSTIPVTAVARMLRPEIPAPVTEACDAISYRGMVLIYIELDQAPFTEFDAHYFPGDDVTVTRMSEPKNYAVREQPEGRTVLCAELPCQVGDPVWSMDDDDLAALLGRDLEASGLPLPHPPVAVTIRRLPQAYPVYLTGYEGPLEQIQDAVDGLPRFVTYGRQGLFAHDNTHHALHMAYCAVECLEGGGFNTERWAEHRVAFQSHVVED